MPANLARRCPARRPASRAISIASTRRPSAHPDCKSQHLPGTLPAPSTLPGTPPDLRRYLLNSSGEQHMSKRIKLPKRIAGIKIPKGIRKGPVVKFLNTPPGQVVLAQALLVIGGAFAVDKARDNDGALHPLED